MLTTTPPACRHQPPQQLWADHTATCNLDVVTNHTSLNDEEQSLSSAINITPAAGGGPEPYYLDGGNGSTHEDKAETNAIVIVLPIGRPAPRRTALRRQTGGGRAGADSEAAA